MKTLILGLLGRAGSGKSTVAKYLESEYGAKRYSLAGPLKALAIDLFGFSLQQVYGTQAEKEAVDTRYGISPREAMIRLGHGMRVHFGENIHVNALLELIAKDAPDIAVVEDVRYENEAREILTYHDSGNGNEWCFDSVVLKLECPDSNSSVNPNAPSEKSVDEVSSKYITKLITAKRSNNATELLFQVEEELKPWLKGKK